MRNAVRSCAILLVCLSCSNPSEPEPTLILEMNQASYAAVDDPDPRFDYAITVIVKFRNESGGVVRLNGCTATSAPPTYVVEPADPGIASWNPAVTCVPQTQYVDLAVGAERTDTLVLRSPWQRTFTGQPVGVSEGSFHLLYEVQMCGTVTRFGTCFIANQYQYARSNRFTISTP